MANSMWTPKHGTWLDVFCSQSATRALMRSTTDNWWSSLALSWCSSLSWWCWIGLVQGPAQASQDLSYVVALIFPWNWTEGSRLNHYKLRHTKCTGESAYIWPCSVLLYITSSAVNVHVLSQCFSDKAFLVHSISQWVNLVGVRERRWERRWTSHPPSN